MFDAARRAALCKDIASGVSVRKACENAKCSQTDFYALMVNDKSFYVEVSRAREAQQDALVDEMQDIADDCGIEKGEVEKARLRIWQRQWTAARLRPKKYGDKQAVEVTGADGGPVLYGWGDATPKV